MPRQLGTLALRCIDNEKHFGIDYARLEALCRMEGLGDGNDSRSTDEAHNTFLISYPKIFLPPKKMFPGIPFQLDRKLARESERRRTRGTDLSQETPPKQTHRRPAEDVLISHLIKALNRLPFERSNSEHQAIHAALKKFPCLTAHLSGLELRKISTIAIMESWEKGLIIFGSSGFYLILKGSVRPYTQEGVRITMDPNLPEIGVGGCFGSLVAQDFCDAGAVIQCVLTQEPCKTLKISHAGYAELKKEIVTQNNALKESLIQRCPFYRQWPKLSVQNLATLIQMKHLPANQVLVKEGQVCPFVAYIREGECSVLQDTGALLKSKGSRVKHVLVGKLGPMESFGELSLLLDQPSPCSIVTATQVQLGIVPPDALKGLDSVTRSLLLQTAQPTHGKKSQVEIRKEHLIQEKQKEWEHFKKKVLSDTLFYNGVLQGYGKWTMTRGRRQEKHRPTLPPLA